MKKYRIGNRWPEAKIEEIEITRETEQSVFLLNHRGKECREAKKSDWHQYHDTWEAAHAALIGKAEVKIEDARARLQSAQDFLGNVKGMVAK